MKFRAVKHALGIYEYRGFIIKKEEDRPGAPWVFVHQDKIEAFDHRAEAMRQIDRLLLRAPELAKGLKPHQLEVLDLVDYCTPENLVEVQRLMYRVGAMATQDDIINRAGLGGDGVLKKLFIAIIAAPWYLIFALIAAPWYWAFTLS